MWCSKTSNISGNEWGGGGNNSCKLVLYSDTDITVLYTSDGATDLNLKQFKSIC